MLELDGTDVAELAIRDKLRDEMEPVSLRRNSGRLSNKMLDAKINKMLATKMMVDTAGMFTFNKDGKLIRPSEGGGVHGRDIQQNNKTI